MEHVTGIGGLFFPSPDPAALAAWYERHLGVTQVPQSYGGTPWRQDAGVTVFAPMPVGAEPLQGRAWAINFRVRNLAAMVAQLRSADIAVTVHEETYPNGRFADLVDPDGNPVQLWEPAGTEAEA